MGGRAVDAFSQHRSRTWRDDDLRSADMRWRRGGRWRRSPVMRRNAVLAKWLSLQWVRQSLIAGLVLALVAVGMRLPFGLGERLEQAVTTILAQNTDTEQAAAALRSLARDGRQWLAVQLQGGLGRDEDALPVTGSEPDGEPEAWLWPAGSEVISSFGWRQTESGKEVFHPGIDLRADPNSPVVAAAGGIVQRVWTDAGGFGLTVEIEHSGGWSTRYARLGAVHITEGDTVQRGQIVGTVGLQATSAPPHLHFELRHQQQEVDPEPKLRRANNGS